MKENAQRLVTETGINDARRLGATALRAEPLGVSWPGAWQPRVWVPWW
jgi:hypothetical protein